MPKRSSKDINQTAASVVAQATNPEPVSVTVNALGFVQLPPSPPPKKKNPAAVALGRLGGKKGGISRATILSDARKKEIAKQGALARWKNKKKSGA